ncbi:hypothetical protein GCM10022221_35970 [Actinocorallia aurea]
MTQEVIWRKSSKSLGGTSEECVELAAMAEGVGLRDSKNVRRGYPVVGRGPFARLVGRLKT